MSNRVTRGRSLVTVVAGEAEAVTLEPVCRSMRFSPDCSYQALSKGMEPERRRGEYCPY